MSDIMKFIVGQDVAEKDVEGRLVDLPEWNESVALATARAEGIDMTDVHWDVVKFVRAYYLEHGAPTSAHRLSQELDRRYAAKGGRKYLYSLFPKGPVTQSTRIAGLPLPQGSIDPSFGSSL